LKTPILFHHSKLWFQHGQSKNKIKIGKNMESGFSVLESIQPNFFFLKLTFFSIFAIKLGHFVVVLLFSYVTK
jgi:hypothetical protein